LTDPFLPFRRQGAQRERKIAMIRCSRCAYGALLAISLGWPGMAFAIGAEDKVQVTAKVTRACTLGNGTLDFGNTIAVQQKLTAHATLKLLCNDTAIKPNVHFDGANGVTEQRYLKDAQGVKQMAYQLLQSLDPGAALWNDTPVPLTGDGTGAFDVTVYGVIPVLALNTPDGRYSDTVTVTLDY
jgi:spore coat protein U-like protein